MSVPFRVGVMQLTMEPLEEMLESARVMDRVGMDTIWLAEAYPWWRKHGMEARSSTVVSALVARETERLSRGATGPLVKECARLARAVLPGAEDAVVWEPAPAHVYSWELERV